MKLSPVSPDSQKLYDSLVTHVVQSFEWGEFRQKLGLNLKRYIITLENGQQEAFQLTLHKVPFLKKYFGYLPKGPFPGFELAEALTKIGKDYSCIAIKIEPDVEKLKAPASPKLPLRQVEDEASQRGEQSSKLKADPKFKVSPKSLFTKHNFILDLTKSEDEILQAMHPKTRYNIKVAEKHGVWVEERIDNAGFEIYLKLYFETTKRQSYHGHSSSYHRLAWETLSKSKMARVLIAFYKPEGKSDPVPLSAWMLFNFKDTLYYPYGGSSIEYRNVMSPTLLAWEAIKLGKKLKLKTFDLWGALGPEADPNHPWQGFHRFKAGLGATAVEYLGTYDIVFNPLLYSLFNLVERFESLKFFLLKILGNKWT
ncbi:MAG: peptidoglycan bridge formation glycyltransferase FemA/FemB family protein [Candidatus Daviesbacteria bacterium]|nr:peptidoglycan bridge formation glycyltransferase FemA/FemB family protein [Candidatus Daviesbacteria bacterium]